ncbi:unnamed protein product [Lepidochelys olivacea]
MILLAALLGLAAVLQPSSGQTPDLASLSTDNASQQKEIADKHNALRRGVMPTASNMLRMVNGVLQLQRMPKVGQMNVLYPTVPKTEGQLQWAVAKISTCQLHPIPGQMQFKPGTVRWKISCMALGQPHQVQSLAIILR